MAFTGTNLLERTQFRRPRRPKEPVPRVGSDPHDAGKASLEVAEFHGTQQRGEFSAERSHRRPALRSRVHRHDQEDRGAREWGRYRLWHSIRCGYRIKRHGMAFRTVGDISRL